MGKSTTAVNLAYTLAQMGARVGIFDADVYGPSLPTMVTPEVRVMAMDPQTRALTPTEYEGVKLVSFGFAGQGSAIMRGPMVSGACPLLSCTCCTPHARCLSGLRHALHIGPAVCCGLLQYFRCIVCMHEDCKGMDLLRMPSHTDAASLRA